MAQIEVNLVTRLLRRVRITDGCWIWCGATNDGKPVAIVDGRKRSVRQLLYKEFMQGDRDRLIPTCGNSLCVNPYHVE